VPERLLVGSFALMVASSLAFASGVPHGHPRLLIARPSNFDYLVLASIADSPHILTMASYRPAAASPKPQARSGKPSARRLAED
jgi:hypothetical protein